MSCLVWESPRGRVVLPLDRTVLVLGSDPVSDLCIPHPTVAGRHALVQVAEGKVTITDLGTATKTKINGAALVADVPSTLEFGDFVNLGEVVVTFLKTPPPAAAAPAAAAPAAAARARPKAAAAPPPRRRPAPPPKREVPWKWIALGLAFVVVALGGAFAALQIAGRRKAPPEVVAARAQPPEPPPPVPERRPPVRDPAPREEPEPPREVPKPEGPARAPAGALPPGAYAPLQDCPDLLEIDGERYLAVRVRDWTGARVEAVGADGKLYALPRARVTKIEDRADLVRRTTARRARLDPEDADGRLALATWCASRHVRDHARQLVDEVLALRPGDGAAMALRATLQGDG